MDSFLCQLLANAFNKGVARRVDLLDISSLLTDAASAIVDDTFLRCFQSASEHPWNWNAYLLPIWSLGVVVRYCILFPLR